MPAPFQRTLTLAAGASLAGTLVELFELTPWRARLPVGAWLTALPVGGMLGLAAGLALAGLGWAARRSGLASTLDAWFDQSCAAGRARVRLAALSILLAGIVFFAAAVQAHRRLVTVVDTDLLGWVGASAMLLLGGAAVALGLAVARISIHPLKARSFIIRPWHFATFVFPLPWLAVPLGVLVLRVEGPSLPRLALALATNAALTVPLASVLARLHRAWTASWIMVHAVLLVLVVSGLTFSRAVLTLDSTASRLAGGVDRAMRRARAVAQRAPAAPARLDRGPHAPFAYARARRFNVLLVMVDALRADRLRFIRDRRTTAPSLDRLAAESIACSRAFSQSASTGESLPSLLSGRYPEYLRRHPRRGNMWSLRPGNVLVSDAFRNAGWQTGARVTAWVERHVAGLERHFEDYARIYPAETWVENVRHSSELAVFEAMSWIEGRDRTRPFFLFLYLEDPHEPYVNHAPPARWFGRSDVDRYDSDVSYTDHWLGVLLTYLRWARLDNDTVVAVVSDHGEEFREHGGRHHGHQLFDESIHVPLLIRIPDETPVQVDHRVALIDLAPTLLDVVGLRAHGELQGVSLLHCALGNQCDENRTLFATLPSRRLLAVMAGDWKLILRQDGGPSRLFDRGADPAERADIVAEHPDTAARLEELARNYFSRASREE